MQAAIIKTTGAIWLVMAWLVTDAMAERNRIDLSGPWRVRIDADEAFDPAASDGDQPVELPGALRDSGLGEPVGPDTGWIGTVRREVWDRPEYRPFQQADDFKVPFWLQPERHYVGPAYYRREVEIPAAWQQARIVLFLERPHWQTTVWVDETAVGSCDSLSTPHCYDLSRVLTPGKHTLTVRGPGALGESF